MVVDVARLEAACEADIARLRDDVGRLMLAGPSDALGDAERQLGEAERRLVSLGLAGAAQERQMAAQLAEEERARREAALKKARSLQSKRGASARQVDQAAVALIVAVNAHADVCESQQAAFADAGMPAAVGAARLQGIHVEGAFANAMGDSAVRLSRLGMWERLPVLPEVSKCPLAESDIDMRGWTLPALETTDQVEEGEQ